jgi:uncharacterized protein YoxC
MHNFNSILDELANVLRDGDTDSDTKKHVTLLMSDIISKHYLTIQYENFYTRLENENIKYKKHLQNELDELAEMNNDFGTNETCDQQNEIKDLIHDLEYPIFTELQRRENLEIKVKNIDETISTFGDRLSGIENNEEELFRDVNELIDNGKEVKSKLNNINDNFNDVWDVNELWETRINTVETSVTDVSNSLKELTELPTGCEANGGPTGCEANGGLTGCEANGGPTGCEANGGPTSFNSISDMFPSLYSTQITGTEPYLENKFNPYQSRTEAEAEAEGLYNGTSNAEGLYNGTSNAEGLYNGTSNAEGLYNNECFTPHNI